MKLIGNNVSFNNVKPSGIYVGTNDVNVKTIKIVK